MLTLMLGVMLSMPEATTSTEVDLQLAPRQSATTVTLPLNVPTDFVPPAVDVPSGLPPTTPDTDDLAGIFTMLIQAARDRNWNMLFAAICLLLVALINVLLFKLKVLPEKARDIVLPIAAVVVGCLLVTYFAMQSGATIGQGLLAGFGTGTSAIGLWALAGKWIVALFKYLLARFLAKRGI